MVFSVVIYGDHTRVIDVDLSARPVALQIVE